MGPNQTIDELTRRNVSIIAEMERAASGVRTRGDRVADRIASAVGSWTFIIIQTALLTLWIVLNLIAWVQHWDPYPFILLNLALSFQSAYAAPILMISQNRQAKLSERRNHLDLQINMLAEQETTEILRLLRMLCEHTGLRLDDVGEGMGLTEETRHSEIVKQIHSEIESQIEQVVQAAETACAKAELAGVGEGEEHAADRNGAMREAGGDPRQRPAAG
jgi:uncharacterized membrane protein